MEQYVIKTSYSRDRMNLIAKNSGARNKGFLRVVFCLYAFFNLYMAIKHFGVGQIGDGIRDLILIFVCIIIIAGSILLPPILYRNMLANRGYDKEISIEISDEVCKINTYAIDKALPIGSVNVIRDYTKYIELLFEDKTNIYLFKDDFVKGSPSDLVELLFSKIRSSQMPNTGI